MGYEEDLGPHGRNRECVEAQLSILYDALEELENRFLRIIVIQKNIHSICHTIHIHCSNIGVV